MGLNQIMMSGSEPHAWFPAKAPSVGDVISQGRLLGLGMVAEEWEVGMDGAFQEGLRRKARNGC